jgi:glycosyltransferase involved in cell wall biosynthesis
LHDSPDSQDQLLSAADAAGRGPEPRPLMLGLGWFPDSLGGLERYFRELFEQLPGARAVVIGSAADAPATVRSAGEASTGLARRLLGFRRAAAGAAEEIDLIDAHFALYAIGPLRSRALRDRPAVFHFHGPWAQENQTDGDESRLRLALRRALERRALSRARETIVLSSAFRRVLVERYGLAPWQIHVWPPGVAHDRFTPGDPLAARERLGLPAGAFVAVCARRLVARMGIDVLLDAWEGLQGELPDGSCLLLVGQGPLGEQLAARAARPPLAGSVRLLGRVSDEELLGAYRAADVAVVPSLAFEGFGLVVLEAAACGTPSIVTAVGGLPETLAGLDRTLVVAPGDSPALGARLLSASHGALPARDATRAHAERFDWREVGERHRRLYRRLLAGERDERMRVVVLDHVARLSGGEIALLRILPHLERVNVHVILGEDGPLAERLGEAGVSVEVLAIAPAARDLRKGAVGASAGAPRAALETARYVARLTARLRRLNPDLVHTNSLKSGVYGALAARLTGTPLLWHLRDRIAEDYLPRGAVRLMRGSIGTLADGVLANSRATLDTVPGGSRNRLRLVIPDSVLAPPATAAGRRAETTFGMLGRIAPWKGQDLFLRAFAAAFAEGGERAVIVGTPMFGEEDYERELLQLVSGLGLDGRVEFRGFREDIWRELAGFDVLVHASVIPEPFGQVVLEGMASGLAVIAPDEGGPADVIADGETGRLFASRDAGSLAAAMRELRDSPERRERLGTAAREAVAAYHPDAIAARLQDAYAQLLGD